MNPAKSSKKSTSRTRRLRQRRKIGIIAHVPVAITEHDILALRLWGGLKESDIENRDAMAVALRRILTIATKKSHAMQRVPHSA